MSRNAIETARAEADSHRDGLSAALSALLSNRTPDATGHAVVGQVADTARLLAARARANPASIALVTAGLAMLAMPATRTTREPQASPEAPLSGEADARIERAADRHQQEARIAANRVDVGPGRAQALRMKLDAGLDRLSPDARARVRAARLQAVAAQEKLERQAVRIAETARTTHTRNPMLTVLAALGVGALVGAVLPGTRREAELLGAKRDQLLREAEAVLRAEIGILETQGKEAVNAGMTAARDALEGRENRSVNV